MYYSKIIFLVCVNPEFGRVAIHTTYDMSFGHSYIGTYRMVN